MILGDWHLLEMLKQKSKEVGNDLMESNKEAMCYRHNAEIVVLQKLVQELVEQNLVLADKLMELTGQSIFKKINWFCRVQSYPVEFNYAVKNKNKTSGPFNSQIEAYNKAYELANAITFAYIVVWPEYENV